MCNFIMEHLLLVGSVNEMKVILYLCTCTWPTEPPNVTSLCYVPNQFEKASKLVHKIQCWSTYDVSIKFCRHFFTIILKISSNMSGIQWEIRSTLNSKSSQRPHVWFWLEHFPQPSYNWTFWLDEPDFTTELRTHKMFSKLSQCLWQREPKLPFHHFKSLLKVSLVPSRTRLLLPFGFLKFWCY